MNHVSLDGLSHLQVPHCVHRIWPASLLTPDSTSSSAVPTAETCSAVVPSGSMEGAWSATESPLGGWFSAVRSCLLFCLKWFSLNAALNLQMFVCLFNINL